MRRRAARSTWCTSTSRDCEPPSATRRGSRRACPATSSCAATRSSTRASSRSSRSKPVPPPAQAIMRRRCVYEQALGLWRGDVLADVQLEGEAQIDVARLDQMRHLVSEERIDSGLSLGRHRELIPELERHVRDEPLAERPRAQLMLALYRSGRQTDALERYRDGRALLVEHSGVEPGPELRRLERAILQHDPALELAPATATADDPAAPERSAGRCAAALRPAADSRPRRGGGSRADRRSRVVRKHPRQLQRPHCRSPPG